jgi:hypothetical protein
LKLLSPHCRRPYKTCSDVIRIVFSLLMSPSSGGPEQASSSEIEGGQDHVRERVKRHIFLG